METELKKTQVLFDKNKQIFKIIIYELACAWQIISKNKF